MNRHVVLVCGGRDFFDGRFIYLILDKIHSEKCITKIVHGDATGADQMAHLWAVQNYIPVTRYPADWKTHGKAAGPIRNQLMLEAESPDVVIAFPGGRGTANMVKLAKAAGVPVNKVECAGVCGGGRMINKEIIDRAVAAHRRFRAAFPIRDCYTSSATILADAYVELIDAQAERDAESERRRKRFNAVVEEIRKIKKGDE